MAKYSDKMYAAVKVANKRKPGVRLGAACIDAQIPVQVVSKWFNITRQGVYYWFTGATEVADKHLVKVERITAVLISALNADELPAKNLPEAMEIIKKYREKLK